MKGRTRDGRGGVVTKAISDPAHVVAAAEHVMAKLGEEHHLSEAMRAVLADTRGFERVKLEAIQGVLANHFLELMMTYQDAVMRAAYYDDGEASQKFDDYCWGEACLDIIAALVDEPPAAPTPDDGQAAP